MFDVPMIQQADRVGQQHLDAQQNSQMMSLQKLMGRYGVQDPAGMQALMGQVGQQRNAGALALRGHLSEAQARAMLQQHKLEMFYRQLQGQNSDEVRSMIGAGLGGLGGILGSAFAPKPQTPDWSSYFANYSPYHQDLLNPLGQTYESAPQWFTSGRGR